MIYIPELAFLDTNILIYALDTNTGKKEISLSLIQEKGSTISSQVLVELGNICYSKFKKTPSSISSIVEIFTDQLDMTKVDDEIIISAMSLLSRYSFSYWDSLIVAAALHSGCTKLYSEDMQNGLQIDTLTIINPYI